MRTADVTRLKEPYPGDATAPSPGPAGALGVEVPRWAALEQEILTDLSVESPFGIGWWAPHPGTSRRILISDQLYSCTNSVESNLREAALHWLEFLECADRESDFMANAVSVKDGQLLVKAPRRNSPIEDITADLVRLHSAGVARALSGALDCLAGTIVGVVALPTSILKASFGGVRIIFEKQSALKAPSEGEQAQAAFGSRLEALVAAAGPPGWLDWTLALRNMLVHRGRRTEIGQLVPREPVLLGPTGTPIPRVRVVTQLPLDPGRSDVEVFLDPAITPVLTEDAAQR